MSPKPMRLDHRFAGLNGFAVPFGSLFASRSICSARASNRVEAQIAHHWWLGFQQLLAAVGLGEVGVVLGLETSRLARSSSDWHRLLQMCGLTNALILDEDGLYNPGHFNDRLLLGLKGTMNQAELHVLRARLIGASWPRPAVASWR